MRTIAGGMVVLLAAGMAQAQPTSTPAPRRANAVRHLPAHGAILGMPVDNWFTLDAAVAPSLIRKFDVEPSKTGSEEITVYGRRGHNAEAEYRAEMRDRDATYEARNSVSAQPLYGGQAVWDSPEQQHVMSDAKEALGLCDALGGLLTCPGK
jgi:hypothetical protein